MVRRLVLRFMNGHLSLRERTLSRRWFALVYRRKHSSSEVIWIRGHLIKGALVDRNAFYCVVYGWAGFYDCELRFGSLYDYRSQLSAIDYPIA